VCSQHQLSLAHQTIRCARLAGGEKAALGKKHRRTTIIHRTVWWANGRQRQRSTARSADDAWPAATVGWAHRTVSGAPTDLEDQRSDAPEKEGDRSPDNYSDCPVVHRTVRCTTRQRGKFGLPSWPPTAPSCLGAIKGTPRHMEESTKHPLSILRLPHSASAQLIDCVSDLSSVWVVNSLCYVLSSSLDLCACVCCRFVSCVCCSSQPYSVLLCDLYCKGKRLQFVEIPRKREQYSKGKDCGIQVDHQITWRGLSATLVH
jgi:hypothetical protein